MWANVNNLALPTNNVPRAKLARMDSVAMDALITKIAQVPMFVSMPDV